MFGGLQLLFGLKDTRTESPNRNVQVWILICGLPMHSEIVSRPSSQRDRSCGFDPECGVRTCYCLTHAGNARLAVPVQTRAAVRSGALSIGRPCVAACRLVSVFCFCKSIDSPRTTRQKRREQGNKANAEQKRLGEHVLTFLFLHVMITYLLLLFRPAAVCLKCAILRGECRWARTACRKAYHIR